MDDYSTGPYVAIGNEMGILISDLSEDVSIPGDARTSLSDVCILYKTAYRKEIQAIMIPMIYILRVRIANGDTDYFAGDAFIKQISDIVKTMAIDRWQKKRSLGVPLTEGGATTEANHLIILMGYIKPILSALSMKAKQYRGRQNVDFEGIIKRLNSIVTKLSAIDNK